MVSPSSFCAALKEDQFFLIRSSQRELLGISSCATVYKPTSEDSDMG